MSLPETPPTGVLPFEPPATQSADLSEFWHLWRHEKFWACHEALEEVWKAETDVSRRRFLQGLIHCAVAVFQFRRGNPIGAARQWTRAKVRLEPFEPEFENLDVSILLRGIQNEIQSTLKTVDTRELEAQLREKIN